ncbi:MAG: 50S ribosomal protein L29 [Candidatus Hodarchaeales archaeon]
MAILRAAEIRKMSVSDREKRLGELRTELLNHRAKVASGGALETPGRIRAIKRTIARILTIERELVEGPFEEEE